MAEGRTRPTVELIKNAYNHIFNSGLSLSKVQDAALGDRLFTMSDTIGVPGRSIAWKLFLAPNEPLQRPTQSGPTPPLECLRVTRMEYVGLLLEKMRAPDGSYEDGLSIPGQDTFPKGKTGRAGKLGLEKNNPLSLDNENPWTQWFSTVELRKTILQDVERTFPDIGYFRDADVQAQLTTVLFLYAITHPSIGYRQGMHELLAPLYYAVDYDSISEGDKTPGDDQKLCELCSRTWVAADAWALFETLLRGISQWYEWRETPLSDASPFYPHGPTNMEPHVVPIIETCNRIQSTHLRRVDPFLWENMHAAGIEPQIYGIRWLRLLFTREFNMHDAMILWDGIFACDPTFELVQWICVAMLMRIRNYLIPSDYSNQLAYLLRYPPLPPPMASNFDGTPHHASLLLRQALALQMSPTASTGVSVVAENHNLLNISMEVPQTPFVSKQRQSRHRRRDKTTSEERPGVLQSGIKAGHSRQGSSVQLGLPELIARNLLDRGESLGINKTVMSAVSELRRNLPELAASFIRSPSAASTSYAAFPLVDERPQERPPWESRTRFEMERDISDLRTTNKRLGQSLSWIVDVLLQDDGDSKNPEVLKHLKNRKREALESLSYIRDVLMRNATDVDEDRLVGEEEIKDRESKMTSPSIDVPIRRQNDHFAGAPRPPVPAPHLGVGTRKPYTLAGDPSTSDLPGSTSNLHSARLAPRNYTRSNFSDHGQLGVNLPAPAITRLPVSTSIKSRRPPGSASSSSPPSADDRSSRYQVKHDPLGVLP